MAATRWRGCVICGRSGCLLCRVAVAAGVVRDAEGAEASSGDALAVALEANRELSGLAERQRAEIAGLREQVARLVERDAERDAELEELRAGLAVLQRMLFGRSSEKSSPEPQAGGGDDDGGGGARDRGNGKDVWKAPPFPDCGNCVF